MNKITSAFKGLKANIVLLTSVLLQENADNNPAKVEDIQVFT